MPSLTSGADGGMLKRWPGQDATDKVATFHTHTTCSYGHGQLSLCKLLTTSLHPANDFSLAQDLRTTKEATFS